MDSVENHLTILFLPTLPSPTPTLRLLASSFPAPAIHAHPRSHILNTADYARLSSETQVGIIHSDRLYNIGYGSGELR